MSNFKNLISTIDYNGNNCKKFDLQIVDSPLSQKIWKYLKDNVEILIKAVEEDISPLRKINEDFTKVFVNDFQDLGNQRDHYKQMVGRMVFRIMDRLGYDTVGNDNFEGPLIFQNGSKYILITE